MAALLAMAAAALAAAGIVSFCVGLASAVRWRFLQQRIRGYVRPANAEARVGERERQDKAHLGTGLHRRLTRSSLGAVVQGRLVRAGLTLKPSEFILLQLAAGGVAAVAGSVALASAGASASLLAAVVMALVGFTAPLLVLDVRARRRLAAFEKQLPQAIDSMAGTLQAGSTLPQAMEIIAREMRPPIAVEFRRVLRESELGLSFVDSLANVLARVVSPDLLLLNTAISIQYRVGGDLAQIFKGISHTIRERLRIRSEITVLTAQARYSAYIIAVLPVLLFTFLWFTNYDYLSGLFLPETRWMLVGGGVGIVVGFIAMSRIVSIEV